MSWLSMHTDHLLDEFLRVRAICIPLCSLQSAYNSACWQNSKCLKNESLGDRYWGKWGMKVLFFFFILRIFISCVSFGERKTIYCSF